MITFNDLWDIPQDYASKTRWRLRGYKPKKEEKPTALLTDCWNTVAYVNPFELYHESQVEPINGKKAKWRRERLWVTTTKSLTVGAKFYKQDFNKVYEVLEITELDNIKCRVTYKKLCGKENLVFERYISRSSQILILIPF